MSDAPAPTLQTHAYVNVEIYLDEHGTQCLDFVKAEGTVHRFRVTETPIKPDNQGARIVWSGVKRLVHYSATHGRLLDVTDFRPTINVSRSDALTPGLRDGQPLPPPEITASWHETLS